MNKLDHKIVDSAMNYHVLSISALDEQWVIMTNKGLFAPDYGTPFFETKEKAWKRWYQYMRWLILNKYKDDYALSKGCNNRWTFVSTYPMTDREIWEAFKETIFEDYDFKIIQWKDAKRDVCGESRA